MGDPRRGRHLLLVGLVLHLSLLGLLLRELRRLLLLLLLRLL